MLKRERIWRANVYDTWLPLSARWRADVQGTVQLRAERLVCGLMTQGLVTNRVYKNVNVATCLWTPRK